MPEARPAPSCSAWPWMPADSDGASFDRLTDALVDPEDEHLNGDWWGEPVRHVARTVRQQLQAVDTRPLLVSAATGRVDSSTTPPVAPLHDNDEQQPGRGHARAA